jgi:hypothetical protein
VRFVKFVAFLFGAVLTLAGEADMILSLGA